MTIGKRLLLYSERDPSAATLARATSPWGCMSSSCSSLDELRGRIQGGDFDMMVVEPVSTLRKLICESDTEDVLQLTLAEVEKRHIHRVLASTGGNKTRAARILGIDTKTLYNKLKSYQSAEAVARRRLAASTPVQAQR